MRCFNCGFEVTEGDVCPNCGFELKVYRRILYMSARYYNDALERASVRDMSGAIASLQQSLKFNKHNIDARNLLGLVYYEVGEIVNALSQWVVSKNLRPDGNLADRYLHEISTHPDELDAMSGAIRRYNLALKACNKGNYDVAIIQLKKVTQINPRLLKAKQLLSLLYLYKEEYPRARKELIRCADIDRGAVLTNRYRQEAEERIHEQIKAKKRPRRERKASSDATIYRSGNDTVIQPVHRFRISGTLSLVSVAIGLVLGALAAYFLLVPERLLQNTAENNRKIAQISEQADAKSSQIADLEKQLERLKNEQTSLQATIAEYEGNDSVIEAMGSLMAAASEYLEGDEDIKHFADYMESVDETEIEQMGVEGYKVLYDSLVARLGPELSTYYYENGETAFRGGDYETAVRLFALAWQYDDTSSGALYNLAEATRLSGDTDSAKKLYDQVINEFPGTRRAANADARLAELRD